MAPNPRTRRQRDISKPQPSVETPADSAPLLSDSNNLSNNRESNRIDDEPDKNEHHSKRRGIFTPEPKPYDPETYGAWARKHYGERWYEYRNTLLREGKTRLLVLGKMMIMPQPYDPDTYDPERRMPWTPEPESDDPETYTAWGRKHFGDDWYEQRKTMCQERNFYLTGDPVYKERQRALRILEHQVERRPFEPESCPGSEDWKRLWARLSKDFLSAENGNNLASPMPIRDSDSDLSGYDTYDPTLEPREPTAVPNNPWELLEYNRRRFRWDEEEYQFGRIFLKESLIDDARCKREDEEGDRRREEELEEIRKVKYLPGTLIKSGEYEDRMRKFTLRAEGWTQEQIDAADRADHAVYEWHQKNPEPRGSGFAGKAITQEERDVYRVWLQKERAARLRIYGELPPRVSNPFRAQTQVEKNAHDTWRRNIHARVSSQHEQSNQLRRAPDKPEDNTAQVPAKTRKRQPKVHKQRASDIIEDEVRQSKHHITRQRKVYKKERSSQRLAERSAAPLLYKPLLCNPSNISKLNSSSRRAAPKKKLIVVKGAKPQGISKSGREGINRPKAKRSKKRSED